MKENIFSKITKEKEVLFCIWLETEFNCIYCLYYLEV